jgi:hypothetical protein
MLLVVLNMIDVIKIMHHKYHLIILISLPAGAKRRWAVQTMGPLFKLPIFYKFNYRSAGGSLVLDNLYLVLCVKSVICHWWLA